MIIKRVETIWEGQVAVHEKYIKQAKRKKTGLGDNRGQSENDSKGRRFKFES